MITAQTVIAATIITALGVKAEQITPEARFAQDLGADSLDRVDLTMQIEDALGIVIPDEDAARIETVGQLFAFAEKAYAGKATTADMPGVFPRRSA